MGEGCMGALRSIFANLIEIKHYFQIKKLKNNTK